MRKFFDYILFGFLVCITLTIFFVSRVYAEQWIESNVYESVDGPFGRGTQSYTNRCNISWSFSQPIINDRMTNTIQPTSDSWKFYCTPGNEFNIGTTTDNYGNVTTEVTQLYTTDFRYHVDRYDIDLGLHTEKYIRYEFIMRVFGASYAPGSSPTITDSNLVNKYLSTFMVSPVYNQCSVKFGFNNNPNDLGVSCLIGPGEDLNFVMTNMSNQNTAYRVTDSNFQMVLGFNITQPSVVWSGDILGLQYGNNNPSVLGDFFNVDYKIIQSNSDSFFSGFTTSNYNGLTRVIAAPLYLIEGLEASSTSSLTLSIFGNNVTLPSGYSLIWNRPVSKFSDVRVGSFYCSKLCGRNMLINFRNFFGNVFSMWIVYLSIKHLLKVLFGLMDPTSDNVEVF